jgi:hypothetical protein
MIGDTGDAGSTPTEAGATGESETDRLARNMGELLQELRVAQAGVQILFAFLLSVVFTVPFERATAFQRGTELVTVGLTTISAAMLMAPAAWHRMLFRQGHRPWILRWATRVAITGLALLAAAMTGVVLLITDVVIGRWPAVVLAGCSALMFGALWFVMPVVCRTSDRRRAATTPPAEAGG